MATTPNQKPVPSEDYANMRFNAGKLDEFVTSTESTYTDRLGQEHMTAEGIRASADDLRSDLASSDVGKGAALVRLENGRNLQQTTKDQINVKNYGAINDGSYHPLSDVFSSISDAQEIYPFITSLSQSIDWAAMNKAMQDNPGRDVYSPGIAVYSDSLLVPDFSRIVMPGKMYDFEGKNAILAYGTGIKNNIIADCTSTSVANPDAGSPYLADSGSRGDVYRNNDYTSSFSAFIILGVGSGIIGGGVIPYFNGLLGYKGSDGSLADDWDVGVWARNANSWQIDSCCVEGHWRKSGLLVTASNIGGSAVPSCELGQATNSHFGGGFGVEIRAPTTATGTTNYGFAGTDFINCRFRSLNHQSLALSTSSAISAPMAQPSGCLSIDGPVMRGVQFLNSTFITRDDILMFLGVTSEILFDGCYEESRNLKVNGTFITATGSRMVVTSGTAGAKFSNNSKFGVDFSGYYPRESSVTRYTISATGVNSAASMLDDDFTEPMFSSFIGEKLRSASQTWSLLDSAGAHVLDVNATGNLLPAGSLIQGGTIIRTTATTLNVQRVVSGVTTTIMAVFGTGNIQFSGGTISIPSTIFPATDNANTSGTSALRYSATYSVKNMYNATLGDFFGVGSPEGVLTAAIGSTYRRSDGGAATSFYVKESGTGNTGWVAK